MCSHSCPASTAGAASACAAHALEIRKDRTPAALRKLAKETDEARVARRILAIANALDGMCREDAARAAGMDRHTQRDWVLRCNAHGVDGLVARWNGGRPPTFTPEEQAKIVEIMLAGPDVEASGLCACTLEDRLRSAKSGSASACIPGRSGDC